MLDKLNKLSQNLINNKCDQETLFKLSNHKSCVIRKYVAMSSNCSIQTIYSLSKDKCQNVVEAVIANDFTPLDLLYKLYDNSIVSKMVKQFIIKRS